MGFYRWKLLEASIAFQDHLQHNFTGSNWGNLVSCCSVKKTHAHTFAHWNSNGIGFKQIFFWFKAFVEFPTVYLGTYLLFCSLFFLFIFFFSQDKFKDPYLYTPCIKHTCAVLYPANPTIIGRHCPSYMYLVPSDPTGPPIKVLTARIVEGKKGKNHFIFSSSFSLFFFSFL
ncbi:hypothetical protein F4810DRAFT_663435, partial [Camillea tinctor]